MIGSYYTTSFSMLYITLHYKCKIHVLYQIIQHCLILKKECCIWCSKTFKNVQYSTNTPTPTLSQWAKTWPSIIIREIYLINKIITKRSKCQCFLKEKKNSSKAELHRKERNRNHKPYFLRKHWRGRENSIWIKWIWGIYHKNVNNNV